jgi:serine protease Do
VHHIKFRAAIVMAAFAAMTILQIAASPTAAADLRDLLPFGRAHRIAELLPVVVAITTHKSIPDGTDASGAPQTRRAESFGSGFVIDPSGYIATNRHVIEDATDITVTLHDGTALPAKLIGAGNHIDLALLKVEAHKPLPAARWGDSKHVHIGDQVLVIGNPLGVGETVSSGIVSALNRDIMMGPYDDFIQTDAAINHGNSGGPLFDMRGEVIGVNTALFTPNPQGGSVGLGFAIPSNDAQYVLDQLRRFGHTRPGWLGVETQEVTPDIADAIGLDPPHGTIIASPYKDGPAARAGLRDGDVILKFGRETPKDMRALARMVEQATGETVPLTIWRDGKDQVVPVTITEWTEPPAPDAAKPTPAAVTSQPPDLGLHTSTLTDDARAKHDLTAAQKGVLLTEIAPNTPASDQGLAAGDIILRVHGAAVTSPQDVQKQIDDARKEGHRHVLLLVSGRDGLHWVALPLS